RPAVTAPLMPVRRESAAAHAPAAANVSPGRAVSTPAIVGLSPRPCCTSARTGPTEVAPGRRLTATSSTASTTSHPGTRAGEGERSGGEVDWRTGPFYHGVRRGAAGADRPAQPSQSVQYFTPPAW